MVKTKRIKTTTSVGWQRCGCFSWKQSNYCTFLVIAVVNIQQNPLFHIMNFMCVGFHCQSRKSGTITVWYVSYNFHNAQTFTTPKPLSYLDLLWAFKDTQKELQHDQINKFQLILMVIKCEYQMIQFRQILFLHFLYFLVCFSFSASSRRQEEEEDRKEKVEKGTKVKRTLSSLRNRVTGSFNKDKVNLYHRHNIPCCLNCNGMHEILALKD